MYKHVYYLFVHNISIRYAQVVPTNCYIFTHTIVQNPFSLSNMFFLPAYMSIQIFLRPYYFSLFPEMKNK